MEKTMSRDRKISMLSLVMLFLGSAILAWATGGLLVGLLSTGWSFGTLFYGYLTSLGIITEAVTLVEFYSHIKAVEYILCVAFLGIFPAFFKLIDREPKKTTKV